ncbi:MAG: type VI secretion system tip protein VgrG [Planctomycetes bacterium]|nr:type VI secretion system tip protein VgrG [Planctomycetota bacterium]
MIYSTTEIEIGGNRDFEQVESFAVSERLCGLFTMRFVILSSTDLDLKGLLRQPAKATIVQPDGTRRPFRGVVARAARQIDESTGGSFRFQIEAVPALWFMDLRRNCRIFQNQTILEIVEAVCGEHGFSDIDKSCVRQALVAREYCVQWQESDLAFVIRLLEEHGIFWYFRHDEQKHKLVLGDCAAGFDRCLEESVERSSKGGASGITSWRREQRYVAGQVIRRDFDWQAPTALPEGTSSSVLGLPDQATHVDYDYPGGFVTADAATASAEAAMHAVESGYHAIEATSDVVPLQPGGKVELDESLGIANAAHVEREFLVTGVDHLLTGEGYRNRFTCLPTATGFRPPRTQPRPRIPGVQTAFVVGPDGEEIHTDEHGRVKVRFHWDRSETAVPDTTCFLRVAQSWSGAGFGAWFLPRVGSEVVVTFIDGDPDRPLVTGCVYNPSLANPFTPGSTPNVSGWRTKSTADGAADAFHEISFDDTKDAEKLVIQAQKDRALTVKNDDVVAIGHDQTITVKNARTRTVEEGDEAVTIAKGHRTVTVSEGNLTHAVTKGTWSTHTKGAVTLEIDEGDLVTKVVGGARTTEVKGADTLTISEGDRTVEVSAGKETLNVKQGDLETKVDAGKCTIEAGTSIELKVGGNSIKIDAQGITLKAMQVTVQGDTKAEIKAPMVDVAGDGMVTLKGGLIKIG